MILKKLAVIAAVVATVGIGTGSGVLLIGRSQAQVPPPEAAGATGQPPRPSGKPRDRHFEGR